MERQCLETELDAMKILGAHPNIVELIAVIYTERLGPGREELAGLALGMMHGGDVNKIVRCKQFRRFVPESAA